MANFNSDIALSPARAPRFGGVIARRAKIQVPTGLVATDTFSMFKLPKGAVVLGGDVIRDALGTAVSAEVGYLGGTINGVAEDPNAFLAATAIQAAGSTPLSATAGLIDLGPLDAERMVALTLTTVTTPTVGADIVLSMYYMLSA